ncbi:MFS transporter [Alkalicoccobacillus gibsonii]|uniref:MFS transporter n=1 Tax=Alkalicoccobacillus gibsonii TaxID=79881 RepID=A0ABU9VE63_9BACI
MGKWKTLILLLGGIGISNIGGWVYLIALNLTVLNETGSVLAVGLLYILGPIATIFSNAWAGSVIDRVNTRHLMIWLDVGRALCIFCIPLMPSLPLIYLIALVVCMGTAIFEPTSMVFMTKLIPEGDRQKFNALRGFINSCGTLLGPMIAGVLFWIGTTDTAIIVNGVALLLSAGVIMLLPNVDAVKEEKVERLTWKLIKRDFHTVLSFSLSSVYIIKVYLLFAGTIVVMTAVDSIEAGFAKEVIYLSDSTYGFLLAIFGTGIIVGTLINTVFVRKLKLHFLIGFGSVLVAIGYLLYYSSQGFLDAAVAVWIMGFASIFASTGFLTFYQNQIPVAMMGRFGSIFGLVEALIIIILTITVGVIAEWIGIRLAGWVGSLGILVLGGWLSMVVMKKTGRKYFV